MKEVPAFGPSPCKIAVVGEAPGKEEVAEGRPFVGPSGKELRRMLRTVGVGLDSLFVTNVFNIQAGMANDVATSFGVRKDDPKAVVELGPMTTNPATYLATDHLLHFDRLRAELVACSPNIIIALGNTACWALGLGQGIANLRGIVHLTPFPGRLTKVLPTYHPAAILREHPLRAVAIADLEKALHEASSPELHFDNTELWLRPSLDDLRDFGERYMAGAPSLATDVETKRGQITCLSFAPSGDHAIVVPFWQEGPDPSYWDTQSEMKAWEWVRRWIEDPEVIKITQNGLYDTQYFRAHGMVPRGFSEDTMLLHHSLYPELRKGLGFLGSLYTSTPSWKSMRTFRREEALKRDE